MRLSVSDKLLYVWEEEIAALDYCNSEFGKLA